MKAQGMAFSQIISADQGAREHFHVPKYQREYTWGKKEWEQLLQDIDENDEGYFVGSLICVNDVVGALPGEELIYEIVDGQQRLTTLSLLLMAIHANLAAALPGHTFEDATDEEECRSSLPSIRTKLVKRKSGVSTERGGFPVGRYMYFLRVQPSTQNHNLEDYRYLLSEVGALVEQPKPHYFKNRRISLAYAYFRQQLPLDVVKLRKLIHKINQLELVQIIVPSQSDAFKLFESLNNRGVPLSAIDIIKNMMLAQMDRQHNVDIEESYNLWQNLIRALPDVGEQERFLRHFYNTFKHRASVRVEAVSRATRSQVIRIYESLIRQNAEAIFRVLTAQARVYGSLIHPSENGATPHRDGLLELQRVGATSAYQLLLFMLSVPAENLETDLFRRVVDLLVRYYIRRNVTDMPPTRDLDAASIELIETCAARIEAGQILTFDEVASLLVSGNGRPAPLSRFRTALEGSMYAENRDMTRYVLIQLDTSHHTREYRPDFWARDQKDRYIWTVEHALPQTENLPQHWVDMIASGDRERAAEIQEQVVHCLGNLTLSAYNPHLATLPLGQKQQLTERTVQGQAIRIGYQNGLFLNDLEFQCGGQTHTLARATSWSAEMIRARGNRMIDLLCEANKLPGE